MDLGAKFALQPGCVISLDAEETSMSGCLVHTGGMALFFCSCSLTGCVHLSYISAASSGSILEQLQHRFNPFQGSGEVVGICLWTHLGCVETMAQTGADSQPKFRHSEC